MTKKTNLTWPELLALLQKAERDSGLSRYRIAQVTGLQESSIKRYLDGIQVPRADNLIKLAGVLGVKVEVTTP